MAFVVKSPAAIVDELLALQQGSAANADKALDDMRRALMDAWGRFVAPSLSGAAGNVVPLHKVSGD